ncbi:MAG TPA: hypothetical protein VGL81_14195 [Polyangiaceae bacterium]|jgi:hypothetical protein
MRRSKSPARFSPIRGAATLSSTVVAVLAAMTSIGAAGCEDGPNQTYSPTTPGEANSWVAPPGTVTYPSTKNYSYLQGGTNANIICNGAQLAKTWALMDKQPILPPVAAAGLDMAGPGCTPTDPNCTWPGLTIEEAEQVLCQSSNQGDVFGDGQLDNSWGDSAEVLAHYLITTHKIDFLWLGGGYLGNVTATGCAGTASAGHTYTIPILTQIQRDNQPFEIDWAAPKSSTDWRNQLTSALLCTFAPTLASSQDCSETGACIQGSFGDEAYFFLASLGIGFYIASQSAPQPTPSIMDVIQVPLAKVTPFAGASINLKIDAVGPTATTGVLNTMTNKPCVMQFGSQFSEFLSDCVETTGNTTQDTGEYNKLLGGIQHDEERFFFNITGVDLNFGDGRLMPTQVVTDTDIPAATDTASEFDIDQDTLGPIVQDYPGNDTTQNKDAHGNGMMLLQMMRIAQQNLNADMLAANPSFKAHYLGDPTCSDTNPGGPAAGCTGLETVVTTAPQSFITATQTLGSSPSTLTAAELVTLVNAGIADGTPILATNGAPPALSSQSLGMRPGTPNISFCSDLTAAGHTSLETCASTYQGLIIPNSFARVVAVLGKGNKNNLPVDAQDDRFFFKAYVTAMLEYLKAEGTATEAGKDPSKVTIADIDVTPLDTYNLYFDSTGAGQYEQAEYIERQYSQDPNNPNIPLDFVFTADIIHGIMNDYDFSKYLYRGENALYQAMIDERDNSVHEIASQDNALLTNMFGSPVLLAGWADHTADSGPQYTAYYCATNNDPVPCEGQTAPLDANGKILMDETGTQPLLAAYPGAFSGAATAFTLGGAQSPSVPVAVSFVKNSGDTGTGTFASLQAAFVQVPLHQNPYDLTSAPQLGGGAPVAQALVDWVPKQPGIGFPVAQDGQREQLIETAAIDFSGEQITANVDYDFQLDVNGNPTDKMLFLAVETTDFLGDVFVCQDPNTKDLLTARMYTSVETILQWIAAHPTAYATCQLIMEYSPYENYLDYVNSLSNGVRLSSTQGGGFGRIVDGTLFDPSLPNNSLSN